MANIAAGRLRHMVRIEQQVQVKNSFGETSTEWEAIRDELFPCEIRPQNSRELLASQQVSSESTTMIVMRYNASIKASMRAVEVFNGADGTIYNLSPPIRDPDSGREWMQIPATALLNAG